MKFSNNWKWFLGLVMASAISFQYGSVVFDDGKLHSEFFYTSLGLLVVAFIATTILSWLVVLSAAKQEKKHFLRIIVNEDNSLPYERAMAVGSIAAVVVIITISFAFKPEIGIIWIAICVATAVAIVAIHNWSRIYPIRRQEAEVDIEELCDEYAQLKKIPKEDLSFGLILSEIEHFFLHIGWRIKKCFGYVW